MSNLGRWACQVQSITVHYFIQLVYCSVLGRGNIKKVHRICSCCMFPCPGQSVLRFGTRATILIWSSACKAGCGVSQHVIVLNCYRVCCIDWKYIQNRWDLKSGRTSHNNRKTAHYVRKAVGEFVCVCVHMVGIFVSRSLTKRWKNLMWHYLVLLFNNCVYERERERQQRESHSYVTRVIVLSSHIATVPVLLALACKFVCDFVCVDYLLYMIIIFWLFPILIFHLTIYFLQQTLLLCLFLFLSKFCMVPSVFFLSICYFWWFCCCKFLFSLYIFFLKLNKIMEMPFLESGMCDLEPGFPGFVYAITVSDFLILFYV